MGPLIHARARWLGLIAALSMAACAIPKTGFIAKDAPAPTPTESIVVLGVSPSQYRVAFFDGKIVGGRFERSGQHTFLAGTPADGYVVGKAPGDSVIAITAVLRQWDNGVAPKNYALCERDVLVFKVPAGKVLYLGDLHFDSTDATLNVTQAFDPARAKSHLDANYPNLLGPLAISPHEVMRSTCPNIKSTAPYFIHSYTRR